MLLTICIRQMVLASLEEKSRYVLLTEWDNIGEMAQKSFSVKILSPRTQTCFCDNIHIIHIIWGDQQMRSSFILKYHEQNNAGENLHIVNKITNTENQYTIDALA